MLKKADPFSKKSFIKTTTFRKVLLHIKTEENFRKGRVIMVC